ncbi:MAG: SO_0444 family Cu/Zn efflux transporter [Prevotella sp.]|nr:SO_0444 family Cu/Zn efflux transporter [Prevotella sp.]
MQEVIHLINEMSPYLLLGFFLAGIMHAFIPGRYYTNYLARPTLRSVVNAALIGIPLPLCSCGVIPTAMSLRKEGASKGSVAAFLISTPQTGVDSIIATGSLMGWPFAIMRPLAAFIMAIAGGAIVNATDNSSDAMHASSTACQHAHTHKTFWQKMIEALRYAFIDMMEDIGKWLVAGLIVAGLITVFIPDSFFVVFQGNTWASMLLVMCLSLPMYLCATGSIPIAVALMMKGLTPGAALLLLIAGPACNLASMLVVRKVMGTRTLLAYIGSIVIGAIFFGWLTDYLHFNGIINFMSDLTSQEACCEEHTSWFSWLCTAVLSLLLVYALLLPKLGLRKASSCHCHDSSCHCHEENDSCGDGSETCCCHETHDTDTCSCHCHEENHSCGDSSKTCCCHETHDTVQIYHIKGMTCNHCRAAAQGAIERTEGVTAVSIDLAKREARISGTATREALENALNDIGFELED